MFNREIDRSDFFTANLNEDNKKVQGFYQHKAIESFELGKKYYRDINLIFTYDKTNKQWYGTNPNLINEGVSDLTNKKECFSITKFMKKYYLAEKKGTGFVVGTMQERAKLNVEKRGYLMPII